MTNTLPATRDINRQFDNPAFIRMAMAVPMLGREEELILARAWAYDRDQEALHKLIKAYARLAIAAAAKYRNYGLPVSDLMQEGFIGLMQAAERSEPERELRFSTYATWWIRAAIQDYILRNWSIVRTGTTSAQKSLFFNLRRLRARIEGKAQARGELGPIYLTDQTRNEVATALGVSKQDVTAMDQRMAAHDQSLSTPLHDDSMVTASDLLVDTAPNPEEQVMEVRDGKRRVQWLQDGLKKLDPREQSIIAARHLRESGATLEELGVKLKISKERVRQLETRALEKLRHMLHGMAVAA